MVPGKKSPPGAGARAIANIKAQLRDSEARGVRIVLGGKIEGDLVHSFSSTTAESLAPLCYSGSQLLQAKLPFDRILHPVGAPYKPSSQCAPGAWPVFLDVWIRERLVGDVRVPPTIRPKVKRSLWAEHFSGLLRTTYPIG